jgi:SAM-dependent methyltransferase
VQSDYAAIYHDLYARHWWWRAREEIILARLAHLAPPGGFGRILDVGCGDGLLLERLRAFGAPEGVEADASLVTDAGRRRGRIHVGPFDETFRPGTAFGLVLMLDVVEHFADDVAALRRARELLARGGVVLVTVPAFQALWTSHDVVNRHFRRYTRRSFGDAAARAGLRVDDARYLFQWMCPLKLAVRLKERLSPGPVELPGVPPPPVNRALLALSRVERRTYGRLPLPFGSSLLLVARAAS